MRVNHAQICLPQGTPLEKKARNENKHACQRPVRQSGVFRASPL